MMTDHTFTRIGREKTQCEWFKVCDRENLKQNNI